MEATMNKTEIVAALEAAIAATPCPVGTWSVSAGEDYVQLVWTCDATETGEMYGDEPWSEWGGNAIISAAGLPGHDESGCDGYVDQYGYDTVSQWAKWNVEE